jgi:hypothetical protein
LLTIYQDTKGVPYLNDGKTIWFVKDNFDTDSECLRNGLYFYQAHCTIQGLTVNQFYEIMHTENNSKITICYSEDNRTITQMCCFDDMISQQTIEYIGVINLAKCIVKEHYKAELKYYNAKLYFTEWECNGYYKVELKVNDIDNDSLEDIKLLERRIQIYYSQEIKFLIKEKIND